MQINRPRTDCNLNIIVKITLISLYISSQKNIRTENIFENHYIDIKPMLLYIEWFFKNHLGTVIKIIRRRHVTDRLSAR